MRRVRRQSGGKAGVVGAVREVHVWTGPPIGPQGLKRPCATPAPPSGLDWDLWFGPARVRPRNPAYHPVSWRGWVDFGTGALGDMACHAFHVVFRALDLEHPISVHATSTKVVEPSLEMVNGEMRLRPRTANMPETFPHSSIVTWDFPARGGQPPVRLIWYEGGLKPPRPTGTGPGQPLQASGSLNVGDKGVLLGGFSGGPHLLPAERNAECTPPAKTVARTTRHYLEWLEAAKGGPAASLEFGFASRVTEYALLGVVAIRTGRYLEWDAAGMKFTNGAEANALLHKPCRAGWTL